MPELPEVQTIVNDLSKKIIGKVFSDSEVKVAKMVSKNFKSEIINQKVLGIKRRGKMIIIELSDDKFILIHLKLTGQLIFVDKDGMAVGGGHPIKAPQLDLTKFNQFTRIVLTFKDKSQLLFNDLRKFGWMRIVTGNQCLAISNKYGVEPLSKDFTLKRFVEILARRPNLKIKQLLMMQELIAGIGNIYADESLFLSGISPLRQAKTLRPAKISQLRQSIIKKLTEAIKFGGTSVNTFVHPNGERGRFVERLKVYQRSGQKCLRCGSILKRIKIGGRGTVYCEKCQR